MSFTFRTKQADRGKIQLTDNPADGYLLIETGSYLLLFKRFFSFRNK